MKDSRRIAAGGMMAALSIVTLMLGAAIGIGTYAAPMLAAPLLSPVGRRMGRKYQILLWLVVSLLGFLLIADVEQNLMYLCLFGPYPILRPWLERRKKPLRLPLKLLFFNALLLPVEALVVLVLLPTASTTAMNVILLLLGNAVFLAYDRVIPRIEYLLEKRLGKLLPPAI